MINLPEVTEENFDSYIKKISKFPVLSPEDNQTKLLMASINDTNAISSLLCSHMRFVISIAQIYKDRGIDMSELVNLGNKGLLKAIKNYYNGYEKEDFMKVLVWFARNEIIKEFNNINK